VFGAWGLVALCAGCARGDHLRNAQPAIDSASPSWSRSSKNCRAEVLPPRSSNSTAAGPPCSLAAAASISASVPATRMRAAAAAGGVGIGRPARQASYFAAGADRSPATDLASLPQTGRDHSPAASPTTRSLIPKARLQTRKRYENHCRGNRSLDARGDLSADRSQPAFTTPDVQAYMPREVQIRRGFRYLAIWRRSHRRRSWLKANDRHGARGGAAPLSGPRIHSDGSEARGRGPMNVPTCRRAVKSCKDAAERSLSHDGRAQEAGFKPAGDAAGATDREGITYRTSSSAVLTAVKRTPQPICHRRRISRRVDRCASAWIFRWLWRSCNIGLRGLGIRPAIVQRIWAAGRADRNDAAAVESGELWRHAHPPLRKRCSASSSAH